MVTRKNPFNIERREARCIALLILFEVDLTAHDPDTVLQRYIEDSAIKERVRSYTEDLVTGVFKHKSEIDEQISRAAPRFAIDQIAAVDRNVLRVALYEMRDDSAVPFKVAINEAIEVAKDYGGEGSGRFVNGVLGTISAERSAASETT